MVHRVERLHRIQVTAERVLGAAAEMSRTSEQLSAEIHRFLDGVRAA
ncbi:hypothetical protein [Methylobacterium sp. UNC378MF]|nr:hypothetical protein [Methylobacterium sp. UNC378MF]